MSRHETFRLFFIENGKTVARREWVGVPRVGDYMMLSPYAEDRHIVRVLEVMWGVAEDDHMQNGPTLNIEVERRSKL